MLNPAIFKAYDVRGIYGTDLDDVIKRPKLADTTHHFDPERNGAILPLKPLTQLAELLAHRVDRVLTGAAKEETWVEDNNFGARDRGDPR